LFQFHSLDLADEDLVTIFQLVLLGLQDLDLTLFFGTEASDVDIDEFLAILVQHLELVPEVVEDAAEGTVDIGCNEFDVVFAANSIDDRID
jgi:hypothetical protein